MLFEDDDVETNLNVNEDFKKWYEHNEWRKLIEKSSTMKIDEEEDESSDDEEAELINETVEWKFLETIAKIWEGDKEFIHWEENVFKDEDFEIEETVKKEEGGTFK